MLKLYEQCVLQWVIVRSKDQRSFQVEMTGSRLGERVGPSLFNLDPHGLLLLKGRKLRNIATQASLARQEKARQSAAKFRAS